MQRRASRADTEGLIDARGLGSFQKDFMVPWRSAREIVGRPTSVSQRQRVGCRCARDARPPSRSPSLSLPSAPLPTFLPNQIHLMRQRDSPTRLAFHLGASCAKWMVLPLPAHSTLPTVVGGVPPLSSFSLMGRNWGTKALWKRERAGRAEGELKVTRR